MFEKHKHICIIIRYMWVPPLKRGRLSYQLHKLLYDENSFTDYKFEYFMV
jgi:hypothetical protein